MRQNAIAVFSRTDTRSASGNIFRNGHALDPRNLLERRRDRSEVQKKKVLPLEGRESRHELARARPARPLELEPAQGERGAAKIPVGSAARGRRGTEPRRSRRRGAGREALAIPGRRKRFAVSGEPFRNSSPNR